MAETTPTTTVTFHGADNQSDVVYVVRLDERTGMRTQEAFDAEVARLTFMADEHRVEGKHVTITNAPRMAVHDADKLAEAIARSREGAAQCENCGLGYGLDDHGVPKTQQAYTCDDCGGYVDEKEDFG